VPEPAGADQPFAEHLLLAATAGDEAAFAAIYLVLQPRLVRYARGLVGQDADDVSAEAWLQIARDIGRFSGDPQSFCGWAARVVRNRALDHLRALGRRPVNSAPIEEFFDVAAANDTAGEAIEHLSTNAALDLIATLPREQAEAVLLRAVVGLDAKTAGEVLGKSAGAVRVSAHRGLKNLAKRL
jgi:RNA polymerase sigma-70 factor (ECF subfamily)